MSLKTKIKKFQRFIAGMLIAIMLFNELGSLYIPGFAVPEAKAQGTLVTNTLKSLASMVTQQIAPKQIVATTGTKLGIVAILVENSLLDDKTSYSTNGSASTLRERIFAYAQNIQKRMPHTRAIVLGIDPKESVFKISTVLEKLYFEGADNVMINSGKPGSGGKKDNNHLVGVVLVGDVPTPVVYEKDGSVSPSLYPYTDFDRKRFIYDHKTGHYEENTNALKPTPEIWHGVIVPPAQDDKAKRQELADFFYKNNQYSNNLGGYNTLNKRMLYYNFPAVEKKLNTLDYGNYKRLMKFLEEIAFHRFNRNLLQEVVQDVSADMEPDTAPEDRTPMIDDNSIKSMMGTGIELVIKKFTTNFASALQTYLGRLNTKISETGRWSEKEYDSLASLISLRDTYMQTTLIGKNIQLEKLIDKEIAVVQENIDLINTVKVSAEESFDLFAYIDGTRVLDGIWSAGDCGLNRGQERPAGVSVLENNSAMVESNRLYDPDSVAIPPEDDESKPEELSAYNDYGGCVGNNAIKISTEVEGEAYELGPQKCDTKAAVKPVFDIAGSKEMTTSFYKPSDPKPANPFRLPAEQCTLKNLSFLPFSIPAKGLYDDDSAFKQKAYCHASFPPGACLLPFGLAPDTQFDEMIGKLFSKMVADKEIVINPLDPKDILLLVGGGRTHLQLIRILQTLLPKGLIQTRNFDDSGTVNVTFIATTKSIKSMVKHVEPSDQTLSTTCKSQVTQTMPSDGIRYVEFYKNGVRHYYLYPNLFRIKGNNENEITQNLVKMIQEEDAKLNNLLGQQKYVIAKFFVGGDTPAQTLQNLLKMVQGEKVDLMEPILWRQLGIDQKHQLILEKYLNRDSFLPVPNPNALPPSTKPSGYEVLHIFANGDEKGFKFAINGSRLTEDNLKDPELDSAGKALNDAKKSASSSEGVTGAAPPADQEKMFSCGAKDGVEIWEWFPKLVGCWIPDEIGKLADMVSMDSSCTGGDIPMPEETPEDAVFDTMENTDLTESNPANIPAKLEVKVDKKTLVQGEDTPVNVKILNSAGKGVAGYIETPMTFALGNSKLGIFDESSLSIFTGAGKVKLTALKESGQTDINIKLGDISAKETIKVVDSIKVKLTYEKITGKPAYKITANLVDPTGKPITDVDTEIQVNPLNPADGKFVSKLLKLQNGTGEATFYPNPASKNIKVTSVHPVYTSEPISVPPIENDPFKIVIDTPADLPVGEEVDIPVRVTNIYGVTSGGVTDIYGVTKGGFNDTIKVKVTDKFKNYGSLTSGDVKITSGMGVIKLKVGKETGRINLVATHSALAPGTASIPIVAKITEDKWSQTFPQNLFASFIGFPAGNFLKENYFAGAHLFNGKTEAVFSFMTDIPLTPVITIMPNYKIKTGGTEQVAEITNYENSLGLEVIDRKTLKSLIGVTIPLNFDKVDIWDEKAALTPGTIYFGLTDETYTAQLQNGVIFVYNADGDKAAAINNYRMIFIDSKFNLSLETESDLDLLELILSGENGEVGRFYLNYKPETLDQADFITDSGYGMRVRYTGTSTDDPKGLILFDKSEEPDESKLLTEDFGFTGANKYIARFGGGSNAGEAVMWNLPVNAVLLGDPTIRLENKSSTSLNYDSTIGRQIYQDSEEADIVALTNFDFNNDNIEDVAAILKDGRIRLFEGGATDPLYIDKGNIAYLADGVLSVTSFDFKNDGYDDLLVATQEGRLAILHNNKEIITRTDQKINVGKQLYKITKADMDMDGYPDLVTQDSRGDIRIFYNKNNVIPENGALLGNYGFSITLGQNLKDNLQIRYPNMPEPKDLSKSAAATGSSSKTTAPPSSGPVTADNPYGFPTFEIPPLPDLTAISSFKDKDTSKSVSEAQAKAVMDIQKKATQDAIAGTGAATTEIPKLPWKEGDATETYFAPLIQYASNYSVVKKVENKNRPKAKDLDLEETLKYTIELTPNKDVSNFVLTDTVPDSLLLDKKTVKCDGTGCSNIGTTVNSIYLFMSNLNLKAGKKITITYEASVKHTPEAAVLIQNLDSKTKLNAAIQYDNYKDILVSPSGNDTGQLIAYASTGPRMYKITTTKKEEDLAVSDALKNYAEGIAELNKLKDLKINKDTKVSKDFMNNILKKTGMDKVQSDLKECKVDPSGAPPKMTPEQCAVDPNACAGDALDDAMDFISNFSCMGGGCFPMPFNMAFMAPKTIPGIAMPLISFPATFLVPPFMIPVPFPAFFGLIPMPLGAADIPGPIMSMIRLYMIPTLTGGIGIGFCWGPYMGAAPVPPPLIPIPYPPPIGNCMEFALPMGAMPPCKMIAKGITALMEAANSAISDVNSGISAVNNSGLPVGIEQKGSASGGAAGGLEIGLATNLGKSNKFSPPAKSFSNKHISTYDIVFGKISGWWERQQLEFFNKLLTLPTLRVVLPDIPGMLSGDWSEFDKLTTAWWNNVSGTGRSAVAAGKGIAGAASNIATAFTGEKKKSASSGFLENYKTIEQEISAFNTSAIDDLYAIVNSVPYINLDEKYIDFKIPYISYAQIKDLIRDFDQAIIYYKKQVQKYKDLLATLKCSGQDKTATDCVLYQILSRIVVDVDKLVNSITDNIKALQSYLKFPRDVILLKKQVAEYLSQIACVMETLSTLLGGWLITIQDQMIGYVEVYYTILNVIKNIKKLFKIFTNFEDNCDICTNDRFSNFGWIMLLGLVIPDIPIIKFPRWPDFVIDFSDFKAEINIEMPSIHFIGQPIKLPRIPRIPFPDVPDVNFALQIPAIPVLPKLPPIPKLPPLPAIPTLKLPTLPPPPKLPNITQSFEVIFDLIELLLKIWCLIKKSFTPIPEAYLGDNTVTLTNRPAYLLPLDMLQIKLSDISLLDTGFNEIDIQTKIYLGLRLKVVAEKVQKAADEWNNMIPTDWSHLFDNFTKAASELSSDISEGLEAGATAAEKWTDENVQGWLDKQGLKMEEFDQKYFRSAEADMQGLYDSAVESLGDVFASATQDMVNGVAKFKKAATNLSEQLRNTFSDALSGTFLQFMSEADEKVDVEAFFKKQFFDKLNKGLNEGLINGTFTQEECEKELNQFTAEEKWMQDIIDKAREQNCTVQPQANAATGISESGQTGYVSPELKNALTDTFNKLISTINTVNNSEPVDYKVLKKEYSIPDYRLPAIPTAVDKIQAMKNKLLQESQRLKDEVKDMDNSGDLYAYVQSQLEVPTATVQASKATSDNTVASLPEKSDTSNLIAQASSGSQSGSQQSSSGSGSGSSGVCVGTCLVDPKTGLSVSFIPYVDNPATVKTAFIPTKVPKKSNVVYSDGPALYLKRDLSVPLDITANIAPPVPNIIFSPSDFLTSGSTVNPHKEAINMLATTLTENGAANFAWKENTNPEQYGIGIELERSILGYDPNKQNNGLPDVTFVLLPLEADGTVPKVTVGDKVVQFGTLVTSLKDDKEARKIFGIESKTMITGADKVYFHTVASGNRHLGITLKPTKAVYFDLYSGPGYRMNMDNGFHHIKMTWFDKTGRTSNYNHSELLSPQIYANAVEPIDTLFDKNFQFPVYKEGIINASEIFTDISGGRYQYYWNMVVDGLPKISYGKKLIIPAQKEPKVINVEMTASISPGNSSFTEYKKKFKVTIYVPAISLEKDPLKTNGEVKGAMAPLNKNDSLLDIPFSVFRKRWGIWKNLGLLKQKRNTPTTPPLSDKNTYKNNYYAIDLTAGSYGYLIKGFSSGPSNVMITDSTPKDVARVLLDTGQIEMLDRNYDIKVTPASRLLPTRASIVKKGFDTVLSNIYYVADSNTDAVILDEPLTQTNVSDIGVTLGDLNTGDPLIAKNMPGYAESFPGGAAVFNKDTRINIALIDTSGAVRMMSSGYSLRFKNIGNLKEKVIFQLLDESGKPIFDIFIAADFNNLNIKQDEVWNDLKTQIGYLKNKIKPMFASLVAQSDPIVKKPAQPLSPFPDVDKSNPNYKAILDLYQRRIISGYTDGTFKPDAKISRGEFVKIALGATNCFDCSKPTDKQRAKYTGFAPFPDVNLPAWYYFCVAIAKELKMVTGYGDGFFRPEQNISRAEAAAILLRQSGIAIEKAPEDYFLDVPSYAWYIDYIYTAVKIGLVKESAGFVFPDEEITRGEFAFMASGVLNLKDCRLVDSDKDGMPDWWEMENNLDPLYAADAKDDNDNDNFNNLQEYKNGTDPNEFNAPEALCPFLDNPNQGDSDIDGKIDVCDDDIDNDGIKNPLGIFDKNGLIDYQKAATSNDNCIFIANANQTDSDKNKIGDECDALSADQAGPPKDLCAGIPEDLDAYHDDDGCPELNDALREECPYIDNANQNDTDKDGIIDPCDDDIDNDGIKNNTGIFDDKGNFDPEKAKGSADNCIFVPNPDQKDTDKDGIGDVCTDDMDGDGIKDSADNCPTVPNTDQKDSDNNGIGDACEYAKPKCKNATCYYKQKPGVYVNKGPLCYFLDWENDLVKDDIIMTAITDVITHDIIYSQSSEVTY